MERTYRSTGVILFLTLLGMLALLLVLDRQDPCRWHRATCPYHREPGAIRGMKFRMPVGIEEKIGRIGRIRPIRPIRPIPPIRLKA